MGKPTTLDPVAAAERAAISARLRAGEHPHAIARALDLNVGTVYAAARRMGLASPVVAGERKPPKQGVRKLDPARTPELLRRFAAGEDPAVLARDYGIAVPTLRAYAQRAGVRQPPKLGPPRPRYLRQTTRPPKEPRQPKAPREDGRIRLPREQWAVVAYRVATGEPYATIASDYGVSAQTIRRIAPRRETMTISENAARNAEMRRRYESGLSTIALAEQYGLSRQGVCNAIRAAGGALRPAGMPPLPVEQTVVWREQQAARARRQARRALTAEQTAEAVRRYRAGEHPRAIAPALGIHWAGVYRLLRRAGEPLNHPRAPRTRVDKHSTV
jgi:hypothetical protein